MVHFLKIGPFAVVKRTVDALALLMDLLLTASGSALSLRSFKMFARPDCDTNERKPKSARRVPLELELMIYTMCKANY
jgi:hypothetical protein